MRRPVRRSFEPSVLPVHEEEIDPYHMFTVLGPSMIDAARYARKFARHHSGTNVGACLSAAIVEDDHVVEVGMFLGANQNLQKGPNNTKMCAERVGLAVAKQAGFNKLIAMVVCGPPQPDAQSGLAAEVMVTCGEERVLYWENEELREMVEDDALHVSVHPTEDKFIIQETAELFTSHALPDDAPPKIIKDHKFEVWRKAGPLYLREIAYIESQGEEPSRPLVAKLAITGELADAA